MAHQVLKNIVYSKTERESLTADIYLPEQGEARPMVIMVHGGGFHTGSKEMYRAWGPYLAENGIAAMAINYRLATLQTPSYPGILSDMEAAINFVVDHAHEWKVEPTNIGFMGDSAGAYLGTMAAFGQERASAKIRFVVCAYGVMDITDWAEYTNATRTDFVINKMFGQDSATGKYRYQEGCPMHVIDQAVRNPFFRTQFYMIWGDQDETVLPENQTLAFIKKLEQYEIPHQKLCVRGQGHFWFTSNGDCPSSEFEGAVKEVAPEVLSFMNTVLTGPQKVVKWC